MKEQDWLKFIKQSPQIALEVVVWRTGKSDQKEVLLIKRPPSDQYYGHLWHVPGTLLRNHESFASGFKRLEKEEYRTKFKLRPRFITLKNLLHEPRGHELSLCFVAQLLGQAKNGRWWPFGKLPKNLVHYHGKMIKTALDNLHTPQKHN